MPQKRVSIKDIAEAAGVSHPTVSRALRGEGRMSDETRQRILELAQEMGYTPSLVARGLVTQRSHLIGLVITTFADPFHNEVVQGVEEEAIRHGYDIFVASTGVNAEREKEVVRSFQGRQVDGIIVSSSRVGDDYADLLQETGIPIVLINSHIAGSRFHAVHHDDYAGGCQIMAHLLERGYRRIAYLGNARAGKANTDRHRAWEDSLQAAGLEAELAIYGPNGRLAGGVRATEALLPAARERWGAPPDAICCYNDTMAIGAMAVLHRCGLRIPDDVAVTGFDDIDVAAYLEPPLTTFHQPRHQLGVEAMQVMLSLLGQTNPHPPRQVRTLIGRLVVRRSS